METIKTNSCLWVFTVISNIIILIFGLAILASGIYLSIIIKKVDVLAIILFILALVIILISLIVICYAKYSSKTMLFVLIIHILLFILVAILAVYLTVDYSTLIDKLMEQVNSDNKAEIRKSIENNISFEQIFSYSILGVKVSVDIIFIYITILTNSF